MSAIHVRPIPNLSSPDRDSLSLLIEFLQNQGANQATVCIGTSGFRILSLAINDYLSRIYGPIEFTYLLPSAELVNRVRYSQFIFPDLAVGDLVLVDLGEDSNAEGLVIFTKTDTCIITRNPNPIRLGSDWKA